MVLAAFSESASLSNQKLWPESFTLRQFRHAARQLPVLAVVLQLAGHQPRHVDVTVLLAASAAFAFSRLRFTGRRAGLLALLLIQMFPASLAFVAIYLMVQRLAIFEDLGPGSMATIVLFYLGGALGANAWLIKGFFDTIPRSLDESAKIDGATHAQIFWKIILPLAMPVLAIIFLLSFISAQAEFLIASVILFGQDIVVAVEDAWPRVCRVCSPATATTCGWGPFAAGALIASIPVVLLFQFLQRFIVGGHHRRGGQGLSDASSSGDGCRQLRRAGGEGEAAGRRGVGTVATAHHTASGLDHGDRGDDVVRLQPGVDDEVDVAHRQLGVGVAVAAVAHEASPPAHRVEQRPLTGIGEHRRRRAVDDGVIERDPAASTQLADACRAAPSTRRVRRCRRTSPRGTAGGSSRRPGVRRRAARAASPTAVTR